MLSVVVEKLTNQLVKVFPLGFRNVVTILGVIEIVSLDSYIGIVMYQNFVQVTV